MNNNNQSRIATVKSKKYDIKKQREIAKENLRKKAEEIDEEGFNVVEIGVADKEDFLSPYGTEKSIVISEEMDAYLKNATAGIPVKNKLHLKIDCDDVNGNNSKVFSSAIENYYTNQFSEVERKLKFNLLASAIMTVLAVLVFACLLFLENLGANFIVYDIVEIIGWVFMWEAVDMFFFQRKHLHFEQLRCLQLMNAKISFVS